MPDLLDRAAQLHQRALTQCARSRFDLADKGLHRALGYLERPDLADQRRAQLIKVRVLTTLSSVEVELRGQRDPERVAEQRLVEARSIAVGLGEPSVAFAVDNALALQALRRGDHEQALTLFAAAERHVADASVNDASIFYLNRGNLRLQRLELGLARRDLNRCIRLASAVGADTAEHELEVSEFMARHNVGYLEYLAGNLPLSLEIMDQAAAMPVGASLAISALDRARVLIEAGLSDAADRALLGAQEEFRRGRLHQELAETELARAECAVLSGNLTAARALAGSARTRFKRRGNHRWRRVAELSLLAADLADGRPPTRLIGPALRLTDEFAEQGLTMQSKTAALIACAALAAAGRPELAEQRYAALGAVRPTDPIAAKLQHRTVATTLHLRAGRPAQARGEIRRGLGELSRHQAKFGSIDLQTAAAIHGRALVRLDLELALVEARPKSVFDAIERGRAVSHRLTAVTPPAGESAELLAELRQLVEMVRTIGDEPAAQTEATAIRHRMATLYSQLSAISWRVVGRGDVVTPAPMAKVLAAVAERGSTLVSYCRTADDWAAVVLGRGRPRLVRLDAGPDLSRRVLDLARRARADLNVLAYGGVPVEMRHAAEASLRRSLARLDELLIAPLGLGSEALAIVPTGPTTTLPWGCLPSLRGRPIEVAPTATSWLAGTLGAGEMYGVAVEAFSGPGLTGASAEAAAVAKLWEPAATSAIAHPTALGTRRQLARALSSATVVHVAAHGSHMRQNPLFSSLQLADGPLFAYEIADRQLAPHVVLSACELGQATTRPGDEALGLTRVLLQLGARCVVAGVAQVADGVAGEVMANYHRRLAAGADSATALAEATASDPYVPFVCFGSSWTAGRAGNSPTLR
jgi:hypothetical protein